MVAMRDGSTHVLLGGAIRTNLWAAKYPKLSQELGIPTEKFGLEQFTVVLTNPPFGEQLKVKAADCRAAGYSISTYAAMRGPHDHTDLEIGLVYLEQCHRLLRIGGRIGIILPETYFFSYSYRWLPHWLEGRLALRGMINIPMEAFEEFCRAKTNFYIFEKIGHVEAEFDTTRVPKKRTTKKGAAE
jgi:type I restriction enzyme M protein